MSGFTPGPWGPYRQLGKFGADHVVMAENEDRKIATVHHFGNPQPSEANARLIAAAPELLSLLRECREFFDSGDVYDGSITNNLDTRCMDAIAKATQP